MSNDGFTDITRNPGKNRAVIPNQKVIFSFSFNMNGEYMKKALKKLRGVLGLGLTWGVLWAAIAFCIGMVIGVVDPDSIDPGEEALFMSAIVGLQGFVAGAGFGLLLSLAEKRKTVHDLTLTRAAFWGALAVTAPPLISGMPPDAMMIFCPIAAAIAAASVAMARKGVRDNSRLPAFPNPLIDVLAPEPAVDKSPGDAALLRAAAVPISETLMRPAGTDSEDTDSLLRTLPESQFPEQFPSTIQVRSEVSDKAELETRLNVN